MLPKKRPARRPSLRLTASDHRHPRPSCWSPFKFRALIRAEQIGGTGLTHKRGSSQLESQAQSVSWPANPRSLALPGRVAPAICLAPGRSRGFLRRSLHESDRYPAALASCPPPLTSLRVVTHGTKLVGTRRRVGFESKNLKAAYVDVADTPASFVWLGTFNGKLGRKC
jgi:hypothetical protein